MHIVFIHIEREMHLFSKMKDISNCVSDDTSHTMQYILLSWMVGAITMHLFFGHYLKGLSKSKSKSKSKTEAMSS